MKNIEIVSFALSMWVNNIITGDPHLSKSDYIRQGGNVYNLKELTPEQEKFVDEINAIRRIIYNSKDGYVDLSG